MFSELLKKLRENYGYGKTVVPQVKDNEKPWYMSDAEWEELKRKQRYDLTGDPRKPGEK